MFNPNLGLILLLFNTRGFGLLCEQLSSSADRGESPHHTNGLKAPRLTHSVCCDDYYGIIMYMPSMCVCECVSTLLVRYTNTPGGARGSWTSNHVGEPMAFQFKTMWGSP